MLFSFFHSITNSPLIIIFLIFFLFPTVKQPLSVSLYRGVHIQSKIHPCLTVLPFGICLVSCLCSYQGTCRTHIVSGSYRLFLLFNFHSVDICDLAFYKESSEIIRADLSPFSVTHSCEWNRRN